MHENEKHSIAGNGGKKNIAGAEPYPIGSAVLTNSSMKHY